MTLDKLEMVSLDMMLFYEQEKDKMKFSSMSISIIE